MKDWALQQEGQISELKVMKSAAGFYIGRSIMEMGFPLPYSRESQEYFPTEEEAQNALDTGEYTPRNYP
ncbi:MAG: hypothetical protein E6R13_08575 [Spirochaetes bacterium]|nr:MAG: hypothetical protein E6R13_08575 [Spirochaetota bacterium]